MDFNISKRKSFQLSVCIILLILLIPIIANADTKSREGFMFEGSIGLGASFVGDEILFTTPGGFSTGFGITDDIIIGLHVRIAAFPIILGALCKETYFTESETPEDFCMFFLLPFMAPAFTHSLFGIECTYFLFDSPSSPFFMFACGFSFWMDPSIGDVGLGFGATGCAGYEFSRYHRMGCEVMYSTGKGDAEDLDSQILSIMFVYTFRFI